jgi:hypothetical protein
VTFFFGSVAVQPPPPPVLQSSFPEDWRTGGLERKKSQVTFTLSISKDKREWKNSSSSGKKIEEKSSQSILLLQRNAALNIKDENVIYRLQSYFGPLEK